MLVRPKHPGSGPNGELATRHPLHCTWRSMRHRCYYEKHKSYRYYGGAGITVCSRWQLSFWAFVEDVGPRPFLAARAKYAAATKVYDEAFAKEAA